MRILLVCCEPPDEPSRGSVIQTFHFLRSLRENHTVGVWCLESYANEAKDKLLGQADFVCGMQHAARSSLRNRLAWISGRDPMARWGLAGPKNLQSLDRAIAEFQPDIVQFEQLHVAWPILTMLKRNNRPRLIFNAHDAVYVMLRRSLESSRTRSMALSLQRWFVRQVRNFELKVCRSADAVLCVSEVDAEMLKLKNIEKPHFITPNGVDTDFFHPLESKPVGLPPTLVFVGNLHYGPNTDAILFYANEIHPLLNASLPELRVIIIGAVPSSLEGYRGIAGLEFVGFQREIRPHFLQADISVVPLRSGSGTRFKILESWAMGRPVVSTTIGAEGLPFKDGENILIADDPKAFADAVLRLLTEPQLKARLAANARALVEQRFSWGAITRDLQGALAQTLNIPSVEGCTL